MLELYRNKLMEHPESYEYGAEAFETYMEESNLDIKSDIKEVAEKCGIKER